MDTIIYMASRSVTFESPYKEPAGHRDTVASTVERFDVVSDEDQLELWRTYKECRAGAQGRIPTSKAAREKWRAQQRQGDEALERLIGSLFRLVIAEVTSTCDRRYGSDRRSDLREDLRAEAYAAMQVAIDTYNPDKGWNLAGFVVLKVRSVLREAMRGDSLDSWDRVAAFASRAESTLMVSLGRRPSDAEIRDEVIRYCMDWAGTRIMAGGVSRDAEDFDEQARAKLVKNGTWAAIEKLNEVRASKVTTVSLDAPLGDDGTTSLLDMLGDGADRKEAMGVLEWFLASLGDQDRYLLVRRFGLDGEPEATYEDLAEQVGGSWPEVRARIGALLGRMNSPLAMFTSLDQSLETRMEIDHQPTVAGRLAARRSLSS